MAGIPVDEERESRERELFAGEEDFFVPRNNLLTLVIDEKTGMAKNDVFEAAEIYTSKKISPKTERLRVSRIQGQNGNLTVTIDKGEKIYDVFEEKIRLVWIFSGDESKDHVEKKWFELSFDKKFKERVFDSYLPYIMEKAKEMKEKNKTVQIKSRQYHHGWNSITLDHPSTFETVAMDPCLKKLIIDDLERFLKRKDFYKRVGKAWKRVYLLYGPPGTGKSSLIAAMANYLKFDIYDLELGSMQHNFKDILMTTGNRSILVIEDIDCNPATHDRDDESDIYQYQPPNRSILDTKLNLSALLNFIDGLWSSCGNERIIIFTTNHKDRLDPALLRPGRMDIHINMSYCTPESFKILASNYLGESCKSHRLFGDIVTLIECLEVTPAEVAEELMKSEDIDVVFQGMLRFLKQKINIEKDRAETSRKLKKNKKNKNLERKKNRKEEDNDDDDNDNDNNFEE
ncbi:AAA-ATPase At2g18193-like [Rutidosis leptorrhynchoides]|uniref:AAA-ATPase At2g18193-like n=1 Tax=Rutidosis leptorrhynchoides TaxID=125765 RepID=UPI003A9A6240